MQQRSLDSCPTEHSHLMKRAHRQSRRDYKQTVESIQRMDAGGILLPGESINGSVNGQGSEIGQARDYHALMSANGSHPTSGEQHHHHQKKKKKRDEGDGFMSIITWYTGNDLLDRKHKQKKGLAVYHLLCRFYLQQRPVSPKGNGRRRTRA